MRQGLSQVKLASRHISSSIGYNDVGGCQGVRSLNNTWRYCNEKWPWHFTKIIFYYKPMLSSSARRLQLTKERQQLAVRKQVRWCRAIPFQHFPKETMIFKNAQISIPTTQVFRKYPIVRQICPQMEKLFFLETWKINWGRVNRSAKATNHCGTFTYGS